MHIRVLLILALLVSTPLALIAVPAKRGSIVAPQSDGSTIEILKFGDESFRYTTTSDDYLIAQRDGIYYYSEISSDANVTISNQPAHDSDQRDDNERVFLTTRTKRAAQLHLNTAATTRSQQRQLALSTTRSSSSDSNIGTTRALGDIRGIVILVESTDEAFTYTNAEFHSMLNDENYSNNGGTGSARDFYIDNSMGQFQPSFDVVGPYTLSESMAYYGANSSSGEDLYPRTMVKEACELANAAGLDFSNYDSDDDGDVDMVFIFYAGYNEAEGGGDNTIWPHMWSLATAQNYDGKSVYTYACTSELKGSGEKKNATKEMAGIGTFTHEYGHTLGLADNYDTTGEVDGESTGLFTYDIMCYGSYNNDGITPPYYCAYQRYELGWIEPKTITSIDDYELDNISTNSAYIVETEIDNEYFLFEYRNSASRGMRMWDGYIGYDLDGDELYTDVDGLLITHIDRSTNSVGSYTASQMWQLNRPNGNLSHECARIVYSDESVTALDMSSRSYAKDLRSTLFPSPSGNSEFGSSSSPAAVSWGGVTLPIELSNIRTLNSNLLFTNGTPSTENEEVDTATYGEGYPFIGFEWEEWSDTHVTLKLSLKNMPNHEFEDATWWLNGVEISGSAKQIVKMGGSYRVVCEVTTDDEVVRITKCIEL
ncbi:MAG: M6 family metalloprotease domain-containing protein [Rikenellaceae bacterium]